MVPGCGRFYKVESRNDCYDIAQDASIEMTDFYTWNPAIGNCSGLQENVYVCIGLGGPLYTTITSGTPIPATPTPYQAICTSFLSVLVCWIEEGGGWWRVPYFNCKRC